MVGDLNKLTGNPMKDHILAKQIEVWWPQLDKALADIETTAPAATPPRRSTQEMLEEALTLLRDMARERPSPSPGRTGSVSPWKEVVTEATTSDESLRRLTADARVALAGLMQPKQLNLLEYSYDINAADELEVTVSAPFELPDDVKLAIAKIAAKYGFSLDFARSVAS
jgi:hypothetical protein